MRAILTNFTRLLNSLRNWHYYHQISTHENALNNEALEKPKPFSQLAKQTYTKDECFTKPTSKTTSSILKYRPTFNCLLFLLFCFSLFLETHVTGHTLIRS